MIFLGNDPTIFYVMNDKPGVIYLGVIRKINNRYMATTSIGYNHETIGTFNNLEDASNSLKDYRDKLERLKCKIRTI